MGKKIVFNVDDLDSRARVISKPPSAKQYISELYSRVFYELHEGNYESLRRDVVKFSRISSLGNSNRKSLNEIRDRLNVYDAKGKGLEGVCLLSTEEDDFSYVADIEFARSELDKFSLYVENKIDIIDRLVLDSELSFAYASLLTAYNKELNIVNNRLNIVKMISYSGKDKIIERNLGLSANLTPGIDNKFDNLDEQEDFIASYARAYRLTKDIDTKFEKLEGVLLKDNFRNELYEVYDESSKGDLSLKVLSGYLNNQLPDLSRGASHLF